MTDYRQAYSWQAAVAFASPLMSLCEQLPSSEGLGWVSQVQAMAIDLPASIANDIEEGSQTRFEVVRRIETALTVIDKVYPALDATSLLKHIDVLRPQLAAERLQDAPQPKPEPLESGDADDAAEAGSPTPSADGAAGVSLVPTIEENNV